MSYEIMDFLWSIIQICLCLFLEFLAGLSVLGAINTCRLVSLQKKGYFENVESLIVFVLFSAVAVLFSALLVMIIYFEPIICTISLLIFFVAIVIPLRKKILILGFK